MDQLPGELSPYVPKILSTRRAKVDIAIEKNQAPLPWQSLIGGTPYLLKVEDYPRNSAGDPLFFLAQINFSEVPCLPGLPSKGLLQFYIEDGDLWGLDLVDPFNQEGFRVIYHADVVESPGRLIRDFSFLTPFEDVPLRSETSLLMHFTPGEDLLPPDDFGFDYLFGPDFFDQFGVKEWEIANALATYTDCSGHKIGGYPDFTQSDPRPEGSTLQLLFQLDSDSSIPMQWGDMGVAHFFITAEDLQAHRFDRVLYSWDCP